MHKFSLRDAPSLISVFILLAIIGHVNPASAQVISDPRTLEFSPSLDHNSTLPDGRPVVDRYEVSFFYQGATAPFQVNSLGKPAPGSNGLIHVDLATSLPAWPLGPGTVDEARVAAIGPGGVGQSSPSNPFVFTSTCSYALSTTTASIAAAGGMGSLSVNTQSGCAWTAVSSASWITVTLGSSMTGVGFANFSVAANQSASARTGTLTVAGQTVTVTQAGTSCTYSLTTTALSAPSTAGTGSVGVTALAGCAWTAVSSASWLTVTGGTGSGAGTAAFSVTANSSTSPRTGTLTVAGQTVSVTQAAGSTIQSSATLASSTYFGGFGDEFDQGAAIDAAGNLYVVGGSMDASFPSTIGTCGTTDATVIKFSPLGALLWARCLGGSAKDYVHSIAIDALGDVYVSGVTYSTNYPVTAGAYQTTLRGVKDVFVTKLSADGRTIVWSTYLGGSGEEGDRSGLAVDAQKNVWLTSVTNSFDLPTTTGAYQRALKGPSDGFVVKLAADGRTLLASTYLGGTGVDSIISGVNVHTDGSVYVAGRTTSTDFPTTAGAYQLAYGGGLADGVVTRLSPTLSTLVFSTYVGGSGEDWVSENHGLTVDPAGRAILAGMTGSNDFPVSATAFQKVNKGGTDTWVAILSADGRALPFATYLGGTAQELNSGVSFDNSGNVYVTGDTVSAGFPVSANALQGTLRSSTGSDAFVTKFGPDLSTILFSTYFGGTQADRGRGIAVDRQSGKIAIAGDSLSDDFPTTASAPRRYRTGGKDFVLFALQPSSSSSCTFTVSPANVSFGAGGGTSTVTVTASSSTCGWTAATGGFVTVSPTGGTGNSTVTFAAPANTTASSRTQTVMVAGQAVAVMQAGNSCSYALSATALLLASGPGGGSVGVSAPAGCSWTTASNASWITMTSALQGSGTGTVLFAVAANTASSARTGSLTVAGQTVTITQQAPATCAYTLSTTAAALAATAGTSSVGVTASAGCAWTAASNAGWIVVTGGNSGSGSGTVTFSAAANPSSSPRTGTLTVANQTVTVSQKGASCTYTLSSTAVPLAATAGTGSVGVTALSGCSWTAVSGAGWLTVTGGSSGTATGTVTFSATANPSTSPRSGTLTVAGQAVTVTQAGASCSYTLSSTKVSVASTAGNGSIGVTTTLASCTWTATSNVGWIAVTSGSSSSGAATVAFSVTANPSTSARTGTLTVAGQLVTVTQAPGTCTYTLSSSGQAFASAGGSGSVSVTTSGSQCQWNASSAASWLTITSGSTGTGPGTVAYAAAANSSDADVSSTLSIAGLTFTVSVAAAERAPTVVKVRSEPQLQSAVQSLASDTIIVLAPGTYALSRTLTITGDLRNITLQGSTSNPDDVVLVGKGMNNANFGSVAEGIVTQGIVDGLTVANLTVRDMYLHAVRFAPGTHAPRLTNVRLVNAGQSFVRSDLDATLGGVDDGVVEKSLFERSDASRDANTTAIDVRGGARWHITRNLFWNLAAPAGQIGSPAVLMTGGSSGTVAEQNRFLNCQRGIAYGWTDRAGYDHSAGVIRNNQFYRAASRTGEAAVMVFDSPGTKVLHNTVLVSGTYPTPIEYRFQDTVGVLIANNLLDGSIWARDGAIGQDTANDGTAAAIHFVNAAGGDLHLVPGAPAIDTATPLQDVLTDQDGDPRPIGAAADMGADEAAGPNHAPTVTIMTPVGGSTVSAPGMVQIAATAADVDGSVARVDFYADSVLLGSAIAAPYEFAWKTRLTGSIQITAVATDDAGAATTSAPVVITVKRKGGG